MLHLRAHIPTVSDSPPDSYGRFGSRNFSIELLSYKSSLGYLEEYSYQSIYLSFGQTCVYAVLVSLGFGVFKYGYLNRHAL
jgi:hypothetical protein